MQADEAEVTTTDVIDQTAFSEELETPEIAVSAKDSALEIDWPTVPDPVGLTDTRPEVQLAVQQDMDFVAPPVPLDEEDSMINEEEKQPWSIESSRGLERAAAANVRNKTTAPDYSETEAESLSFKPDLISNEKLRDKAKSAGYGKTSVVVKPPPEPQSFTFKPDLSSGLNKKTTEKREAAKGSNYGKAIPKKKVVSPPTPSFTPEVNVSSRTTILREKASSKISDAVHRNAIEGKKKREAAAEHAKAQASEARYTLASDKTVQGTESLKKVSLNSTMVLDGVRAASNELAQCSTNKVVIPQPSPVKISTRTHKMKANVKSSYSSDYKTEKGSKRIIPSQPAQMGVSKSIPLEKTVPAELPTVHSPIKTSAVKSQYSAQSYVPAKTERPKTANGSRPTTPVWKPNSKTSPVVEKSKEIKGKTADARKSATSSGYGVKSPIVSIAAKVESMKVRSPSGLLRTADYKGQMTKPNKKESDGENTENETPKLGRNSSSMLNDLLQKAGTPLKMTTVQKATADLASEEEHVEVTML